MHINFVGTRALLIDLDGLNQVMDWHAALSAKPLKNQVDCIAAATTLLLTFEAPDSARDAAEFLQDFSPTAATAAEARTWVITTPQVSAAVLLITTRTSLQMR